MYGIITQGGLVAVSIHMRTSRFQSTHEDNLPYVFQFQYFSNKSTSFVTDQKPGAYPNRERHYRPSTTYYRRLEHPFKIALACQGTSINDEDFVMLSLNLSSMLYAFRAYQSLPRYLFVLGIIKC